ncbi:hypothetical protein V2K57_07875 [Pseudomonas alliivorans]|nr:hypothetical protein [Pseudomonas alliivorans]MEE4700315.1 hypothetical protein [Pseudomonas alliivorans]MEE4736294.1 hypothetical protein [Pseudomonas alliivorans]MEE4742822.1 hypothetical protein [Pseudomonas alliivorans]MEE5094913.1 hypothetical protein [Pseudomonas alliivorans]
MNHDEFLKQLVKAGFRGNIALSYGRRIMLATNNPIYQRLSQAAVFPLNAQDDEILATLAG